MDVLEWYFGFHPKDTIRAAIRKRKWTMLGHVEAWGYTGDRTWLFYDPRSEGTLIHVTHHHDEVTELLAGRYATCQSILRITPPERKISIPFHPMMNCVAQCAHLIGVRAYLPSTLHRILRSNHAEELIK